MGKTASRQSFVGARNASRPVSAELVFSICTIVNDYSQYQAMLDSFKNSGFEATTSEFLYIDNAASNEFDCYEGLNLLIQQCKGEYLVLCHQDVRLLSDNYHVLLDRLKQLETIDSTWALAGNAGKTENGEYRIRITDLHGVDQLRGPLPARVVSLDENFIVLKRSALLAFSGDLRGYHLYGTDICIQAEVRGKSAYVVDFHLEHLGAGIVTKDFFACADALESKYLRVFRHRLIKTPSTRVFVGAKRWQLFLRSLLRVRKRRKILSLAARTNS